jgi:hypothetical protein
VLPNFQARRERQAKLADARRLADVEYVQAAHALLEAADFAIDEKARKDGGAAHYIQMSFALSPSGSSQPVHRGLRPPDPSLRGPRLAADRQRDGGDARTPMDNQAGGIGHITSTSYACISNVYDVQSEKLLSRIWSASSRRAHLTALAESGTPVEDQANLRTQPGDIAQIKR